jgi:hypothetical protein
MSKIAIILLVILAAVVLGFVLVPFILSLAAFLIKVAITFGLLLAFALGVFIGRFFPRKKPTNDI